MSGGYRKWQEPSSVRSRSWQRFLAEVFRGLRISRLPQGGEQSLVSYRLFVTTVFSLLTPLSSGNGSLLPLLDLSERRHLTRGALCNYTGDIELDQFFIFPAASAALAQRRSSLASRCTFSFWLCATSSSLSFPAVPFSPKSPRVARTLQAEETGWRTSQLDCPKVGAG